MINVSAEELAAIIAAIDAALTQHDAWRESFQRTLICRLPPSAGDLDADAERHCPFSRWLYGRGNEHLLSIPAFKSIEATHADMHTMVRRMYEQRFAGHVTAVEDYDAYLKAAAAFSAELLDLKERAQYTLQNLDPLTGAYMQAQLLPELRNEQQRQRESGEAHTLFLVDLDLKELNKKRGQGAGDRLLHSAVGYMRRELSVKDRIYRSVGAEFVICLAHRSAQEVERLKERLTAGIGSALSEATNKSETRFTVDFAIVDLAADVDVEQLLDQAQWLSCQIDV
jgi:diguanylate cyclase (GGDEF)-like protein